MPNIPPILGAEKFEKGGVTFFGARVASIEFAGRFSIFSHFQHIGDRVVILQMT